MHPATFIKTAAALTISLATTISMAAEPLSIDVYNGGEKSFGVHATLIKGEKEAILLDTGFTKADALQIAAKVLDSGKELKTIVISQADPDYYFGAEVLHQLFPKADIVTTAAVQHEIEKKLPNKLKTWGPMLGANAPVTPIIPKVMPSNTLTLDGQTIEVRGTDGILANRPYVWIPSIKTIAGDVNTYNQVHVWMADVKTPEGRQAWQQRLTEMAELKPETVVAGHVGAAVANDPSSIAFTQKYLSDFENALKNAKTSAEVIAQMKQIYPKLAGESSLELGAKVTLGEMEW